MPRLHCSVCDKAEHIMLVCPDCCRAFCQEHGRLHVQHPAPDDFDERDRYRISTPSAVSGTDGASAMEDYGDSMNQGSDK